MMDECVNQTFFLHKKNYCYVIVLLLTFDSSICTSNIKNIYRFIKKFPFFQRFLFERTRVQ